MEDTMRRTLLALILIGFSAPALSQQMTPGTITKVRTGWNADYFAIETVEPIQNPANCLVPDGYLSASSLPGYSTYYAAVLMAYSLSQPVVITVHTTQCAVDRPMIIGINLGR
jgi:hypothetical protein